MRKTKEFEKELEHFHENENISSEFTVYMPKDFNFIRNQDKKMVNFSESLNVYDNIIKNTPEKIEGGFTGSFFYLSYDKQLLIKSIMDEEMEVLKNSIS